MKYSVIFAAILFQLVNADENFLLFENFKKEHGKQYSSRIEETRKFEIFKSNLMKIAEHNSKPHETWKMAVTQFADLTEEEFRREVVGLGYIRTPQQSASLR